MDVVLRILDGAALDSAYGRFKPEWDRENLYRQCISPLHSIHRFPFWRLQLYVITMVATLILYFGIAGGSYFFMFDKRMMRHPRFLKNQIRREITMSVKGFPWLDLMTLPWFLGECRGYSLMYEGVSNSPFGHGMRRGIAYIVCSAALFLWFTDLSIYIVHRVLHWPSVYKHLHKPHHKWVIPTPFASHAFHPIDGYVQSLPYHIFVYIVPLHKYTYLGLFVLVNLWSIFIHDSDMIVGHPLEKIINGPAHHTLHHMYFVYNYGQYFTWADKVGGSYRHPKAEDDPLLGIKPTMEEAKLKFAQEKELLRLQEEQEKAEAKASSASASLRPTATIALRRTVSSTSSSADTAGGISSRSDSGVELSSSSDSDEADSDKKKTTYSSKKEQTRRR